MCGLALSNEEGHYLQMELIHAAKNRSIRQSEIRVNSWMVIEDAKELLKKLHPTKDKFKFSRG